MTIWSGAPGFFGSEFEISIATDDRVDDVKAQAAEARRPSR